MPPKTLICENSTKEIIEIAADKPKTSLQILDKFFRTSKKRWLKGITKTRKGSKNQQ